MKSVQYFSKEYLESSSKLSTSEILEFLENFRLLHTTESKSKLISIKIPESLLEAFKSRCRLIKTPYQTMIKNLMRQWLKADPNVESVLHP